MMKIAIVDDEESVLNSVRRMVEQELTPQDEAEIYTYTEAKEFLQEYKEGCKYDILISDIEMPDMNGLELGKMLQEEKARIYLVFLTCYSEYAAESYKLEAYQYILKIDMEKRLPIILRQLIARVKREKRQYRLIGTPTCKVAVYYRDIIYICKNKGAKYVQYITVNGVYKERIALNQVMKELQSAEFILVERGYIININHIANMLGNIVYMDIGEQIVVSRANLKRAKEQINLYRGSL